MLRYSIDGKVDAFTSMRDSILPYNVICGHQVHGVEVALIDRPDLTRQDLEGYDALITKLPGCAIGVRTADCIPVLLYDPVCKAVAAIHSGWKGTVRRITDHAIGVMEREFGTVASDLKAVIGPGISRNSFQVGPEVIQQFRDAGFPMDMISQYDGEPIQGSMQGGYHIDLILAVRWLLEQKGVPAHSIQDSGICTYLDGRFYSARREGAACGRNINSIKLIP